MVRSDMMADCYYYCSHLIFAAGIAIDYILADTSPAHSALMHQLLHTSLFFYSLRSWQFLSLTIYNSM